MMGQRDPGASVGFEPLAALLRRPHESHSIGQFVREESGSSLEVSAQPRPPDGLQLHLEALCPLHSLAGSSCRRQHYADVIQRDISPS